MIVAQILSIINVAFSALFMLCYAYQVVFMIISLFIKTKKYKETDRSKKYAFIISARNEENVIGQLCDCIARQDYPSELITTYIVADNCTDSTADVARAHGALVYERHNTELIGKGYALTELFEHIKATVGYEAYDAYIVIDADNILEPNYVSEMDKCFSEGNRIVVGYRNSKNFGDNWISAGYGLWFLREARQLNNVRSMFGSSCEVKGTGFMFSNEIMKRQGGWIHHLLIEDVQFTVENVLEGERVAYCHDAMLYDEQPTKMKDSFWQRIRWCRGYLQILKRYTGRLLGGFFCGRGFSNFDMIMCMSPAFFITVAMLTCNIIGFAIIPFVDMSAFLPALLALAGTAISAYLLFLLVAVLTTVYEWKRIRIPNAKKILYCFTFPIFMATYIIIAACSFFVKPEWKPVKHNPVDEKQFELKK